MPSPSGIPFGHYLLIKRLARGGMAEVFLARQSGPQGFDRHVAVKRILPHLVDSPDFVRMFLDEARIAARLSHPNIVHIYEFGQVDDDYFIAMEYVQGVHAGKLIRHAEHEPIPFALAARIGADAAAGLHFAHQLRDVDGTPLRLVHRDISPPNLMISQDGIVKIVDFGIAKAVSRVDQTRPGVVKGKFAYMSPEQTTGKRLDGTSDVFSLSLVLWELLAGRVAVSRSDPVEAMRHLRDGLLPAIESVRPDVPAALATALSCGLHVDPAERPTASEFGLMLEGFIKSSPELGTAPQLSQWIRERFSVDNHSGMRPALTRGGSPARTQATAQATQATARTAHATERRAPQPSRPKQRSLTAPVIPTSGSYPLFDTGEIADLTEVVRPPPSFLTSPEIRRTAARVSTRQTLLPRRRGRLIAIVAAATVVVAIGVLLMLRDQGPTSGSRSASAGADAGAVELTNATDAAARADARPPIDAPPLIDARPPADAEPAPANLEVHTVPPGARVRIGEGEPLPSPARLTDLPAGTVTLSIELAGYESVIEDIELRAGQDRRLDYRLTRRPTTLKRRPPPPRPRRPKRGSLTVRTKPYSTVYWRGRKLGVTPFARVSLPAGTHTLVFKNPKRRPYRRRVVIRSGRTSKLNFRLP